MLRRFVLLSVFVLCAASAVAAPLRILAAESVYGSVAADIAGPVGVVTSVLRTPGQDPHAFEPAASAARAAAAADIVILNGAGYDGWMDRLLGASPSPGRAVIEAAALMRAGPGANPHLWYDPETMPRVANALALALRRRDAGSGAAIEQRLGAFLSDMAVLQARIASLRLRFGGTPVAATESVFGDMAAALGLVVRDAHFQLATMNGTEPLPSDVAAMEADLRGHRVRALIYNTQVVNPATMRLRAIAADAGIPLVGISETLPPNTAYVAWMLAELDKLNRALQGAPDGALTSTQ